MLKYLKQGKYTYNQQDLLGQGSFGKVFKGVNNRTKQQIALKQIQLQKLQTGEQMLKTILLSQISVMRKFNKQMQNDPCPFLVRQEDVFRTDKHIYIVMELCTGGTLQDELRGKIFKEKECIQILYCLCKGLKYMNFMGIVHRDLKPQNIFISSIKMGKGDGKQFKIYKIGDFGFAAQKQQFQIAMGTFPYMAPEMFRKQKYSNKVDVWSVGIIAYQILFGGLYFIGKDKWQIQKNIKQKAFILNAKQKSKASQNYQNFMSNCLNKDPKLRIEIDNMLNHPLFSQIHAQLSSISNTQYINEKQQIKNSQPFMKKVTSELESMEDQIFIQKSNPINQKQNVPVKQQEKQKDAKANTFQKIQFLIKQCQKMRQLAEKFHSLSQSTSRVTEFIQIYLLKDTYVMMNRLTYTVLHKQNHIQLPQTQFQVLLAPQNNELYMDLYEKCIKQCSWITGLFNEKYKWFMNQYILKFAEQDQQLIKKVVNEHPYDFVNNSVFQKQLRKWEQTLSDEKGYDQWKEVKIQCRRILNLKLNV